MVILVQVSVIANFCCAV